MKTKKMRKFAFFMAILMLFTSIDFTSFAAEPAAEKTVAVESQAEDEAMDEAAAAMENEEETKTALTEDIRLESGWTAEGTVVPNDETKTDIAEKVAIPTTDIATVAISEEETIVTTDYGLANPRKDANGNTVWDCVWFGNYWQEDTNGDGTADTNDNKEPIKWRVLSVSGDQALLLADKNLDAVAYNTEWVGVTWETCTMRSWLNGYGADSNDQAISYTNNSFVNAAFTAAEKNAIAATTLVNADNAYWSTEGGNDTTDRVFLLSLDDVVNTTYGFNSDRTVEDTAKRVENTAFAKSQGAYTNTSEEYAGNGYWWLRSPGDYSNHAANVDISGYVIDIGNDVRYSDNAVRPALHLNLSSTTVWSKAGTVTADGSVEETAPGENPSPMPSIEPTETPSDTPSASPSAEPNYGLANPRKDANGNTIWECVWFGNYWQNDTNGDGTADTSDNKEPIKWRVLSVDGDKALLMADKNLDAVAYNTEYVVVTWETCTLRSWLNGYGADSNDQAISYTNDSFIETAFTTAEKNAIAVTTLVNADNAYSGTEGGNDTTDRVFLLSLDDVVNTTYGFNSDSTVYDTARRAANTAFAKSQGAYTNTSEEYADNGFWWLRSPGDYSSLAAIVGYNGYVDSDGNHVSYSENAVRPALYLNLSSTTVWSKAGTVTADGSVEEIEPGENPSPMPSIEPTDTPSAEPSVDPSKVPSTSPSVPASEAPSASPSVDPSEEPSASPSVDPSEVPSTSPSVDPSEVPSASPSVSASEVPSASPSSSPSTTPSVPGNKPQVDVTVNISQTDLETKNQTELNQTVATAVSKTVDTVVSKGINYNGSKQTLDFNLTIGNVRLVEGTDYSVKYRNTVNAGNAQMDIKFLGDYKNLGTVSKTFAINTVNIAGDEVAAADLYYEYKGKAVKPVPVLYYSGKKLRAGKDFEYDKTSITENKTLTIKGIGNFTGSRTIKVTLIDKTKETRTPLAKAKVTINKKLVYTGKAVEPTGADFVVTIGSGKNKVELKQGVDYTVEFSNNNKPGTAVAVIRSIDSSKYCYGEKTVTFKIAGTKLTKAAVTLTVGSKVVGTKKGMEASYTGSAIIPNVTVKLTDAYGKRVELKEGTDYTLSYKKNRKNGTASVVITGTGAYTGSKTVKFKIKEM